MGRGFLLFIFGFGAFASLLTSGLSSPSSSGRASAEELSNGDSASDTQAYSDLSSPGDGQAVQLERGWDGHFYADVEVNGQHINFLVDTGASGIAMSREDARRAGVATSISMPEVVGQGAGGAVHGEVVTLDRVSLGSAQAEDVPAVVLDTGSQSLLGQSFLKKFSSVEIRDDTMILQ